MKNAEDFAGKEIGNPYCIECGDEFGQRKGYENIIDESKKFLIEQLSVSDEEAEKMARENISEIPFWVQREKAMKSKNFILITDVGSTTTKAVLLQKNPSGKFEIIGLQNAATTVEKPVEDVNIGVLEAVTKLQQKTETQLIKPNAETLDLNDDVMYITTSSAGGGLQILVIGLTLFDSASSGERTAYGAGGVILDTFAINDKRTALEQMKAMKILHPDIILMCGGVDGGAISSLLRLGEILQLADPAPKFGEDSKIPLVFAGNKDAQPFISGLFKDKFKMYLVPNLRPTMKDENLLPAREKIHKLFMDNVMEQAPGYSKLKELVADDIIPTPTGVINTLQIISRNTSKNVMSVDIGGATTDIFSNIEGSYFRTVSANYGLSYSISNVMKDTGFENIMNWLPADIDEDYVRNYIADKMLYPTFVPKDETQIAIEQAIAREALKMSKVQHLKMNFNKKNVGILEKAKSKDIEKIVEAFYWGKEQEKKKFHMYDIDIMIGAGGAVSHAETPEQALAIIADGFEPQGITEIWRDPDFISPHLGKLSNVDESLAEKLITEDCFEKIGLCIRPIGKYKKTNTSVADISINDEMHKIKVGNILYFPNTNSDVLEVHIELKKGFFLKDEVRTFAFKTQLPLYIDARISADFTSQNAAMNLFPALQSPDKIESTFSGLLKTENYEIGEGLLKNELPYAGNILVIDGEQVSPDTTIGENLFDPPKVYVISLFDKTYLHLDQTNIKKALCVKEGQEVKIGQRIAEIGNRSLIDDLTFKHFNFESPVRGMIEKINYDSGTIIMREIQDYTHKPKIINLAMKLNIKPKLTARYMKKTLGDFVYAGEMLASRIIDTSGFKYPLSASSPTTGTIKGIDLETGKVTIKYDTEPYRRTAGVYGKVVKTESEKSALISYEGITIKGVIGFGSEAHGSLYYLSNIKDLNKCKPENIVMYPHAVDINFLKEAKRLNVSGVIAPSVNNSDLVEFTGDEIGVALTGSENIPFPLIITAGFGNFETEEKLRKIFEGNHGKHIYINGHTQIRAGVTRPKIIIMNK